MREASGSNPDISTCFFFPFLLVSAFCCCCFCAVFGGLYIYIFSPLVQDVAFQLERLIAGMYIYYRQCHRTLKPAAVFPIEVELGINLERYHSNAEVEEEAVEVTSGTVENGQSLENNSSTTVHEEVQSLEEQGQKSPSQQLPPVEDLLLDFGEPDSIPPLVVD